MTREEAREFLINISYKLGNMSVEYLSEKDGEKMREAIKVLEQEPRKGHWIFDGDCLICNKCKKAYSFTGSNFCPNCGADMREVKDGK